jgi:hypothetical protein
MFNQSALRLPSLAEVQLAWCRAQFLMFYLLTQYAR